MQAALIVHRVTRDPGANLATMQRLAREAARAGAQLALFGEAALTGLVYTGQPAHDRRLAEPIPGPATEALAEVARSQEIYLGFGLLECDGPALYDSAVLLTPGGHVALKYRRIHPGWHRAGAYPSVYREGREVGLAKTTLGTCAFLICDDLFDASIVRSVRALDPDWLLLPFARCFEDGRADQQRWEREQHPEFLRQVKRIGVPTLMVNHLADPGLPGDSSFGGALAVAADGTVLASLPLGTPGILVAELRPDP